MLSALALCLVLSALTPSTSGVRDTSDLGKKVVVMQIDGLTFKYGADTDETPTTAPAAVGRPMQQRTHSMGDNRERVFEEAVGFNMDTQYAVDRDSINMKRMDSLWHAAFKKQEMAIGRDDGNDNDVVLISDGRTTKEEMMEMTRKLFDDFQVTRFIIGSSPYFTYAKAKGAATALVVEIDDFGTTISPFFKGHLLSSFQRHYALSDTALEERMRTLLRQENHHITWYSKYGLNLARAFLRKEGGVKPNRNAANQLSEPEKKWEFAPEPEKTCAEQECVEITVGDAAWRVYEPIFSGGGWDVSGLEHSLTTVVMYALQSVDLDLRRDMFQNIVIAGRIARSTGFEDRLQADLQEEADVGVTVRVTTAEEDAAWEGARMLAQSEDTAKEGHWMYYESDADKTPPIIGFDEEGQRMVTNYALGFK